MAKSSLRCKHPNVVLRRTKRRQLLFYIIQTAEVTLEAKVYYHQMIRIIQATKQVNYQDSWAVRTVRKRYIIRIMSSWCRNPMQSELQLPLENNLGIYWCRRHDARTPSASAHSISVHNHLSKTLPLSSQLQIRGTQNY